jgi:hypothetical protein
VFLGIPGLAPDQSPGASRSDCIEILGDYAHSFTRSAEAAQGPRTAVTDSSPFVQWQGTSISTILPAIT